jgi:hypothetical protein
LWAEFELDRCVCVWVWFSNLFSHTQPHMCT